MSQTRKSDRQQYALYLAICAKYRDDLNIPIGRGVIARGNLWIWRRA